MNKKQKQGALLVLMGLCMVFASLLLHVTELRQDQQAGESAAVLLQQLELSRMSVPGTPEMVHPEESTSDAGVMPEKEYLGYAMIGTWRVPSVGIELPILSSWSYELLNVAPCRYSGSIPEENMILMGHNYKSHFTPLHNLAEGASVEFEDVNGIVYHYSVAEIEILHKNDGELLPSEYPLTLFTCTRGGQNRVVIRCQSNKK